MAKETKTEAHERGYVAGRLFTLASMLRHFLGEHFGLTDQRTIETRVAQLELERLEIVAKLREVCAEHGDNDWPEDLHLGDVLEKHLARHLGA